jgi:transcriptional regulator GlxA family with amidase domain
LLGQEGSDLEEQMMTAASNTQRVQLITAFLEKRITAVQRPEILYAIQLIYKNKGQINCKDLAAQTCLSQRQFERKFKELAGFNPKRFARLVRFNMLVNSPLQPQTLTQLAYEFGYYDQAHFIEEFRSFTGYNPRFYFSGKAPEVFYSSGQLVID